MASIKNFEKATTEIVEKFGARSDGGEAYRAFIAKQPVIKARKSMTNEAFNILNEYEGHAGYSEKELMHRFKNGLIENAPYFEKNKYEFKTAFNNAKDMYYQMYPEKLKFANINNEHLYYKFQDRVMADIHSGNARPLPKGQNPDMYYAKEIAFFDNNYIKAIS